MLFIFFFLYWAHYLRKSKKEKDLFWLTMLIVSVHETWFCCFWAWGKIEHIWQETFHLILPGSRERKKARVWGQDTSFKGVTPNVLCSATRLLLFFFFFFSSCHFLIAHFDMNSSANLTIDSLTTPGHCCIGPNLQTSGWGRFPP